MIGICLTGMTQNVVHEFIAPNSAKGKTRLRLHPVTMKETPAARSSHRISSLITLCQCQASIPDNAITKHLLWLWIRGERVIYHMVYSNRISFLFGKFVYIWDRGSSAHGTAENHVSHDK